MLLWIWSASLFTLHRHTNLQSHFFLRPRECHNKIMQPILSTIFDISSFKPSSVAAPGGCTALFLSEPVATQNTGFLVTSSSKLRKKNYLRFTVRQDYFFFTFHSLINKVGWKQKNCRRKPPPKHSLICLLCSVSDFQSLDESSLNHLAIGATVKMNSALYSNKYALTYELSREKNCLRCFRPGPTQTKQYSNSRWLHACNLFSLCHKQFEFIKLCFWCMLERPIELNVLIWKLKGLLIC